MPFKWPTHHFTLQAAVAESSIRLSGGISKLIVQHATDGHMGNKVIGVAARRRVLPSIIHRWDVRWKFVLEVRAGRAQTARSTDG